MIGRKQRFILDLYTSASVKYRYLEVRKSTWSPTAFKIKFDPRLRSLMEYIQREVNRGGISIAELERKFRLDEHLVHDVTLIFEKLLVLGMIRRISDSDDDLLIRKTLFGVQGNASARPARAKTLLVTEKGLMKTLQDIWVSAGRTGIRFETGSDLSTLNLTRTDDGLNILRDYEKVDHFKNFGVFAFVSSSLDRTVIRNLNRISLRFDKPLAICVIKDLFVLAATFAPRETACFECFERELDPFPNEDSKTVPERSHPVNYRSPVTPLLGGIALLEVSLLSMIGRGYFVGKCLAIQLPTFQVRIKDVFRIPDCPACGYSAMTTPESTYVDLKSLVNEYMGKVGNADMKVRSRKHS